MEHDGKINQWNRFYSNLLLQKVKYFMELVNFGKGLIERKSGITWAHLNYIKMAFFCFTCSIILYFEAFSMILFLFL